MTRNNRLQKYRGSSFLLLNNILGSFGPDVQLNTRSLQLAPGVFFREGVRSRSASWGKICSGCFDPKDGQFKLNSNTRFLRILIFLLTNEQSVFDIWLQSKPQREGLHQVPRDTGRLASVVPMAYGSQVLHGIWRSVHSLQLLGILVVQVPALGRGWCVSGS